ncbi:hypothetical protein MMC14_002711 [Varicellaria rhodocarpa]|nr:hypothetical protein [Varicellaria rhodocarpa]
MANYSKRGSWASSNVLPAEDTTESMEASTFPKSASLKSHKSLPRRRINTERVKFSPPGVLYFASPEQKTCSQLDLSKQIHSWIPEPPRIQPGVTQSLPLTPPSLTRDTEEDNPLGSSVTAERQYSTLYLSIGSGLSTPINQRSPPTPDITPPRRRMKSNNLTPPQTFHKPSSRAESFKTAREHLSSPSQEEGIHCSSPSEPAFDQNQLDNNSKRGGCGEIGLGLDLESSGAIRPYTHDSHFDSFDGAWGSSKEEVNDNSSSATELGPQHSMSLAKAIHKRPYNDEHTFRGSPHDLEESSSALRRGPSLRERVQKSKHSPPSASTERFAEQIEWPLQEKIDIESRMRQIDNRRLSQMSATSTIVEAMVVDTPPKRHRTLRHTSKHISLRTASSLEKGSRQSSLDSDEQLHRLVHRNARVTDRGNQSSKISDGTTILKSGLGKSQRQSFPAADIPQRRSSLKASGKNYHSGNTPAASGSGNLSRPATAPEAASNNQDFLLGKFRTIPSSNISSTTSKSKSAVTKPLPPTIPTRSSSLSAPTSRNVSRTTSLTSTSLHAHNLQNELQNSQAPPQPIFQLTPDTDNPSRTPEVSHSDDFASLRPRSRLVTPFSVASMQSSTPGTLEVNEATVVNIYPHNNRSILVVQQMARRDSQQEPETVATVVEKVNIALTRSKTPPSHRPRQLVDSPLRHPREPPKPPVLSIIPPTPLPPLGPSMAETSRKSDDRDRPLSMIKRALSGRRYSESFISPIRRSFSKRHTFMHRRPAASEDTTNNKFSPFWRPRGFWDDLSDSESDFGNDGPLFRTTSYQQASNNQPPPKVSTLSRKLGSLRLNRRLSIATPRTYSLRRYRSSDSEHSYQFVQADRKDGDANMPRLGYQVHFVGLANIKNGLVKRKIRREESKREKERARLRRSIGISIVQPDARIA